MQIPLLEKHWIKALLIEVGQKVDFRLTDDGDNAELVELNKPPAPILYTEKQVRDAFYAARLQYYPPQPYNPKGSDHGVWKNTYTSFEDWRDKNKKKN